MSRGMEKGGRKLLGIRSEIALLGAFFRLYAIEECLY